MRKRVASLWSFSLLAYFLALPLKAWAADPFLVVGSTSGAPGANVTVPVNFVRGTTDVTSIQFDLILPSSLTYISVSAGSELPAGKLLAPAALPNGVRVLIFGLDTNPIGAGDVADVTLQISNGTPNGPLAVVIQGAVFSDALGNSVPAGASTNGTVTVTGATPPAAITLLKSVSPTTAKSGDIMTFSIQYQNTGGDANSVAIADVIPAGSTFVTGSITGGGALAANTITWNLGSVAGGGSGTVSFQARVN